VNTRGLHLGQQVDRPHRRGTKSSFRMMLASAQRQCEIDRAQIETGREGFLRLACLFRHGALCGHERQQIADVHDALGIDRGFSL